MAGTFVLPPYYGELRKLRPGEKEELAQGHQINLNPDPDSKLIVTKGPSPFKIGNPKTEKTSSPWSPITVLGFSSDEKLGRY